MTSVRDRLGTALEHQWWRTPPTPAARALKPLASLYAALVQLHRLASGPQHVGLPVVVVGNLIVGGAGKTPTTIAVVRVLRAEGWQPGVVSRGHGRRGQGLVDVQPDCLASTCGDEPLLIRLRTGVPVMVGRDRVAAAKALHTQYPGVDIVVADDGLQHHRLARDAQVIVFDERGIGNGLLLPAGPLREPLRAAQQGSTLVLYNAPRVTTDLPGWLATRRLSGVLRLADWWQGKAASTDGWAALQGRPLLAAAGIAVPERFFAMLRDQGLTLAGTLALPDHHAFDTLPWPRETRDVVITEKDAVKLPPQVVQQSGSTTQIWVAPLDLEPEAAFVAAIKHRFPHPRKS